MDFSKMSDAQLRAKLVIPTTSEADKVLVQAELAKRYDSGSTVAPEPTETPKTKKELSEKQLQAVEAQKDFNSEKAEAAAAKKAAAKLAKQQTPEVDNTEAAAAKAQAKAQAKAEAAAAKAQAKAEAKSITASHSFPTVGTQAEYGKAGEVGTVVGIVLDKRVPMYLIRIKTADGKLVHKSLETVKIVQDSPQAEEANTAIQSFRQQLEGMRAIMNLERAEAKLAQMEEEVEIMRAAKEALLATEYGQLILHKLRVKPLE